MCAVKFGIIGQSCQDVLEFDVEPVSSPEGNVKYMTP